MTNSVVTFDIEPVGVEEMQLRIVSVASAYPYFVYEKEGRLVGYCYAHAWKEKAAYRHTLETTIYLSPDVRGEGIGRLLMERLIDECRKLGHRALIACITEGNETSCIFHEQLGFKPVSHFEKVGFKFGRHLDVIDYELLLFP